MPTMLPSAQKQDETATRWRNLGPYALYPVGQSHGIAGGYLRPCPEISPSLLADISAFARRYLRPWPITLRLIPPTGSSYINKVKWS